MKSRLKRAADWTSENFSRRSSLRRGLPVILSLLLMIHSLACGPSAGAVPSNAKMGRCPVCGMMINSSDNWASEIYYKDGTKILFESPGDMMSFYAAPGKYKASEAQQKLENIEKIVVKDYATKQE